MMAPPAADSSSLVGPRVKAASLLSDDPALDELLKMEDLDAVAAALGQAPTMDEHEHDADDDNAVLASVAALLAGDPATRRRRPGHHHQSPLESSTVDDLDDCTTTAEDASSEPSVTGDDPIERRKLLSIERRRKRNREAMQRSRQRDRDYMDGLRATAAALERTHRELLERVNARVAGAADAGGATSTLHARLEAARATADELTQQNRRFQEVITERIKSEDRMEGLLKELIKDQERFTGVLGSLLLETTAPRLTASRAVEIILQSRETRLALERLGLENRSHRAYNFLGWEIRHSFSDKYLFFTFWKTFRNRSTEEISERAWRNAKTLTRYRTATPRVSRRLVTINENTFINARDMNDPSAPNEYLRLYSLRFRVQEPDGGVAIGTQSLRHALATSASIEQLWAHECCLWIKFNPVVECDPMTGATQEHCRVQYIGKVAFGQQAFAQENALETVIGLARWESANVGGLMLLT